MCTSFFSLYFIQTLKQYLLVLEQRYNPQNDALSPIKKLRKQDAAYQRTWEATVLPHSSFSVKVQTAHVEFDSVFY